MLRFAQHDIDEVARVATQSPWREKKSSRERKTTSLKLSVIVRILIMPDGENISVTTSE
jgi:hypothetical protein